MGLVATLMVVIILGILVTIVLAEQNGPAPRSTTADGVTTTTVPKNVASAATDAAISACVANYQAITSLITTYRTLNGVNPPSGTSWATSSSNGGPLVQSWPSAPQYYSIVWNGTTLGVVPTRGEASHGSVGTSSPPTGCYAA